MSSVHSCDRQRTATNEQRIGEWIRQKKVSGSLDPPYCWRFAFCEVPSSWIERDFLHDGYELSFSRILRKVVVDAATAGKQVKARRVSDKLPHVVTRSETPPQEFLKIANFRDFLMIKVMPRLDRDDETLRRVGRDFHWKFRRFRGPELRFRQVKRLSSVGKHSAARMSYFAHVMMPT